jgi:hypothetical protein
LRANLEQCEREAATLLHKNPFLHELVTGENTLKLDKLRKRHSAGDVTETDFLE